MVNFARKLAGSLERDDFRRKRLAGEVSEHQDNVLLH